MIAITKYIADHSPITGIDALKQKMKISLLINASFVGSLSALLYIIVTFIFSFFEGKIIMSTTALALFVLPWLFLVTSNIKVMGNIFITVACCCFGGLMVFTGGLYSPVLPYFSLAPVFANLFIDRFHAWVWLGISSVCISIFLLYDILIGTLPVNYDTSIQNWYFYLVHSGVLLLFVIFTIQFDDAKKKAEQLVNAINDNLSQANQEIISQNEEMHQQAEELQAQQEFIQAKNKELEDKNYFVNQSIKSAEAIQKAVFPAPSDIAPYFDDVFILNKPKDIVSGDFYWFNRVGDKLIMVVADCTGHGISGAFVTLICNTILDKIVLVGGLFSPGEILKQLDNEIRISLKQDNSGNTDGMDGSILVFDLNEDNYPEKLVFAGAKSYILVHNQEGITEYKGDKTHVGGFILRDKTKSFNDTVIPIESGTKIYLGTDGLQDQNSPRRKKYGKKRLIQFYTDHANTPFNQLKENLEQSVMIFKDNEEQRDDILWAGIKIK